MDSAPAVPLVAPQDPPDRERTPPPPLPSSSPRTTFPPPSQLIPSSSTPVAPALGRTASAQSSQSVSSSSTSLSATVYGVALVGFDHALGPNVEFLYPPSLEHNAELKDGLPFLALPDGAHARDEDYTYFHLHLPTLLSANPALPSPPPASASTSTPDPATSTSTELNETVFGISCNRQIMAHELLNKGKEVTRSTVQKAIVVLASKPIFGPLRDKLGVITRSFFAQRDFHDKSVLIDLYQSFQRMSTPDPARISGSTNANPVDAEKGGDDDRQPSAQGHDELSDRKKEKRRSIFGEREDSQEEEGIYMGTFLRELVHKFRFKTLMLLKLLMLQRRVLFYSTTTTVEQLCTFQYSLVALIPALLTSLQDSASPVLANRIHSLEKPTSLKTSDKGSLIRYLGLPLEIFGEGSFFQPYLPLQQIEMLTRSKTYLVGTTNSIIQQQRDCNIDVVVNLDTTTLQILNGSLTPLITLTPADRKWMDVLVTTVDQSWNSSDPTRPEGMGWVGSEDFLRGKFEEYVCSLLACVKFGDYLDARGGHGQGDMLLSAPELESYNPASFNESFIKAFKQTRAFATWDVHTDEAIFDLVEPKHPMEGKTNPFEDVGIRLVSGLHDLHLPDNLLTLSHEAGERLNPTKDAMLRGIESGRDGIWGAVKWARDEAGKRQKELEDQAAQRGGGDKEFSLAGVGVDVAQKGAASVAAGLGGLWGKARNSTLFASTTPSPSPNPSPNPNPNVAAKIRPTSNEVGVERPPSPTPSIVSTTSSTKSSSALVTVQAQLQQQQHGSLTTPPTSSTSTFLSTSPSPRGLRPLSTAVAATPASPSTSPSDTRPSSVTTASGGTLTNGAKPSSAAATAGGGGGGFASFFGGIRKSFVDPTPSAHPTASSSSAAAATKVGNGRGGGGATRGLALPSALTASLSSWTQAGGGGAGGRSPSPASAVNGASIRGPVTPGAADEAEGSAAVEVKEIDLETGEEVVVLRVRDLDQERRDDEERRTRVDEARKRLEGI
ncbi:hypothetical protein JCM11491_006799 [Sporobolomyces phaffii]